MKGSTYRRCYCRHPDTGKPLGNSCPQLTSRRHGTWSVRQELPSRADGTRRSFSRSGLASAREAQELLEQVRALLAVPDPDDPDGQAHVGDMLEQVSRDKAPLPSLADVRRKYSTGQALADRTTVGEWLREWIAGKRGRLTAIERDEVNVRVHLVPRIGHIRLDRLRVDHVTEMFREIEEDNAEIAAANEARRAQQQRCKWGHPGVPPAEERERLAAERERLKQMPPFRHTVGASTMQRIRSTLRAALNDAIAQQRFGLTINVAQHAQLPSGKRPKGLVWTAERVAEWKRTREKPSPVMVWTPEQTAAFLVHTAGDRLYALYHLMAFRGLRRGETCGLRWMDIDREAGTLTVAKQLVEHNWQVYEDDPKTEAGARTIALDSATVEVLREHQVRQEEERRQLGSGWTVTGRVFVAEDGAWLRPSHVTDHFLALSQEAGLPPIRLHDLRHGAATLAHAAGADLHAIKELLGHSGIQVTSETYTHLLHEVDREIAERAAKVVPLPRRGERSGTPAHASLTQKAPERDSEALA